MENLAEKTTRLEEKDRNPRSDNGLQNLVAYYQKLFDIQENVDHYSPTDFQNAKRSFVKYLLKNRPI